MLRAPSLRRFIGISWGPVHLSGSREFSTWRTSLSEVIISPRVGSGAVLMSLSGSKVRVPVVFTVAGVAKLSFSTVVLAYLSECQNPFGPSRAGIMSSRVRPVIARDFWRYLYGSRLIAKSFCRYLIFCVLCAVSVCCRFSRLFVAVALLRWYFQLCQ